MLLEEDVFYDQWVLLTKLCYHLPCFILYSKAKLACYFRYLLIHRLNFPGSYAILLFIVSDFTFITSHIHNWVLFSLWLCLFFLSGVISPFFSSSILGIYRPGELVHLLVSYLFAFSYCSWDSQSKNAEVVCYSLFLRTTFCQNSPP